MDFLETKSSRGVPQQKIGRVVVGPAFNEEGGGGPGSGVLPTPFCGFLSKQLSQQNGAVGRRKGGGVRSEPPLSVGEGSGVPPAFLLEVFFRFHIQPSFPPPSLSYPPAVPWTAPDPPGGSVRRGGRGGRSPLGTPSTGENRHHRCLAGFGGKRDDQISPRSCGNFGRTRTP